MIEVMGVTRVWSKGDVRKANDFPEKFWRAYNLQKYPPVFRLHPLFADSPVDLRKPESYYATLEPLNPLPDGMSREEWGVMIGFGGDPSDLLLGEPESLFGFDIELNTGQLVKLLDQPLAPYPPHYKVTHGAKPR